MAADLAGTHFDAVETLEWGSTSVVQGTVKNYGNQYARGSYADIFLSEDSQIETNDLRVGRVYLSGVNAGATKSFTTNIRLPSNVPSGFSSSDRAYVGVIIDRFDYVDESNETNNSNRRTGYDRDRINVRSAKADLTGSYFDSDEGLKWGQDFYVDAGIANKGTARSIGSTVSFYLSNNDIISTGDYFLGSRNVASVGAGSAYGLSNHKLTLPSNIPSRFTATDDVFVGMIVDSGDVVDESDERNNRNQGSGKDFDPVRVTQENSKPDLVGTYFNSDGNLKWGQYFFVDAKVNNVGNASAGSSKVHFYLSSDSNVTSNDIYLGSRNLGAISTNSSYRFNNQTLRMPTSVPNSFTMTDDVFIGMVVDGSNQVIESNEANNQNQGQSKDRDGIRVTGNSQQQADLSGYWTLAQNGSFAWGNDMKLSRVQIQNTGQGTAGQFRVEWYLSRDKNGSSDDIRLNRTNGSSFYSHSGISANSRGSMFEVDLKLPSRNPPGWSGENFFVVMKTDSANQVSETNEQNNFGGFQSNGWDWDNVTVKSQDAVLLRNIPFVTQVIGIENYLCQFASGAMMLGYKYGMGLGGAQTMHDLSFEAGKGFDGNSDGEKGSHVYETVAAAKRFMAKKGITLSTTEGWLSFDQVKHALKQGNPVSVSLDYEFLGNARAAGSRNYTENHQVVVTGYNEVAGTWSFYDPLQSSERLTTVSSTTFRSAVGAFNNSGTVFAWHLN